MYHMTTPEHHYFFKIPNVELPKETRKHLIERAKQNKDIPLEKFKKVKLSGYDSIASELMFGTISGAQTTAHNVSSSVANEGLRYNWVGMYGLHGLKDVVPDYDPVVDSIYNMFTEEAKKYLFYFIVSSTEPYGYMSPHMDQRTFGKHRESVIFFPLEPYNEKDWAPLTYYTTEGETLPINFYHCYAGNTEAVHGYENNEHYRYHLQVAFLQPMEVLYKLHTENRLFK